MPSTEAGRHRVVLVGAGGMGRHWLSLLHQREDVDLVGVVDLNPAVAAAAAADAGAEGVLVDASLDAVLAQTAATAVVNVTIPEAHLAVSATALQAGTAVLCEKPAASTVAEAMRMAAAAEEAGRLLMVSQSRRYYTALQALKAALPQIGDLGVVTTQFRTAPRFGGFRDHMPHVLLVDMAIHAFDVARFLIGREPIAVFCDEFNPSWSWFDRDAAAIAVFEFEDGIRYLFTGSWCSAGEETSWNGDWVLSGSGGTATWDGESEGVVRLAETGSRSGTGRTDGLEEIAGSLDEFLTALATGQRPSGEIHDNIPSLAMVEAAVRSADEGRRIALNEVLGDAYSSAVEAESDPVLRRRLESWGGPLLRR